MARRTGAWTQDEDDKLKDSVQIHDGKNWDAIARLVPGRTKHQCSKRWRCALDARIVGTTVRTGKWTPAEDDKLKNAVQRYDGKNWGAIIRLVPGRTRSQCQGRWHGGLDTGVVGTTVRTGRWAPDEDDKLKNAVASGKNWDAIARLVPGRTKNQCQGRWHGALVPSVAL
jgi:uncharacterized protein (DUF2237 family)